MSFVRAYFTFVDSTARAADVVANWLCVENLLHINAVMFSCHATALQVNSVFHLHLHVIPAACTIAR